MEWQAKFRFTSLPGRATKQSKFELELAKN